MKVYIEYAILENLLVDGALLYLAQAAARVKVSLLRLLIASILGAAFALLVPFLSLPKTLGALFKLLVGALLCAIAVKKQKSGGRYALTTVLFFAFSFCFGGGLIAFFEAFGVEYYVAEGGGFLSKLPVGGLLAAAAGFTAVCKWGICKLYARKRLFAHIVSCSLTRGQRSVCASGFVDTGNGAVFLGRAVCFVTPDLIYELCGTAVPDGETTVRTVTGERKIRLFFVDEICVAETDGEKKICGAYLSPAVHIVGKPYKLILPAWNDGETE